MEWIQFVTLMGTIIAGVFAFYKLTAERMDRMEQYHREDLTRIDDKWERLFERLLIQDKKVK